MKKYLTLFVVIFLCNSLFGQKEFNFSKHQLSIDFGSFRNRYLYPITDLKYNSPSLQKVKLQFSARLRSYGTLYFFSKGAYDFTPIAEYYFTKTVKPLYFSAGMGIDTRIRLVNDERSEAKSSVEPLICFTLYGHYKKSTFNTPLWTRFYSNGISVSLLPQLSIQVRSGFSITLRHEVSLLSNYNKSTHEWRHDNFIGTHFYF